MDVIKIKHYCQFQELIFGLEFGGNEDECSIESGSASDCDAMEAIFEEFKPVLESWVKERISKLAMPPPLPTSINSSGRQIDLNEA